MRTRKFVCDFETTVYKGQKFTEVWASACVEINKEEVKVFNSIDAFFDYFYNMEDNIIMYFHNLKFDGEFILYYIMNKTDFKQAIQVEDNEKRFKDFKEMENDEYLSVK